MPYDSSSYRETTSDKMRAFLNGGKRWGKDSFYKNRQYCLMGALIAVTQDIRGVAVEQWEDHGHCITDIPAYATLEQAVTGGKEDPEGVAVSQFNDSGFTSFSDIERVLDKMREIELCHV